MSTFYVIGMWTKVSVYNCWVNAVHWKKKKRTQIQNIPRTYVYAKIFGYHNIPQERQPPNSTDMAPCNFTLFSELHSNSNG
jgi:hypothetical protein